MPSAIRRAITGSLTLLFFCTAAPCFANTAPRIVNIYNFIRNSDFRVAHSEDVLFDCTQHQVDLIKQAGLPATWALQYDALINPRYQKLLKEQAGTDDEIAAWWEIPRPLAEKAGLKWRGQHDWDSASNVGFSPGYTPDERLKIVDVYMAEFKSIFGYYPRTVGSWYIDEVTLAYMAERYGIVASCNCKDQVGTDGYTLHGGYWNQAYYPSKLNAYMPAQTKDGQIDVPIFRMLGSDPIDQYGSTRDMNTMEPVYSRAGGSSPWVDSFMNNLIHQPCLAFGFAQVGQENSFGWPSMKTGLTSQIELFSRQSKDGEIQVETLAKAGDWFRQHYPLTPSTAVVAMDDWKHQDRKTVWYDSRFYRVNFLWNSSGFYIRDLHLFDQSVVSPTHDTVLTRSYLSFSTLPIMDGAIWSKKNKAGMWPVLLGSADQTTPMAPEGPPVIKEINTTDLSITQPIHGGGALSIICREDSILFSCVDNEKQPMLWAFNLLGGAQQKSAVQSVTPTSIAYKFNGTDYHLHLAPDSGRCDQQADDSIRIKSNTAGVLVMTIKK
jgi:hypothetical protein